LTIIGYVGVNIGHSVAVMFYAVNLMPIVVNATSGLISFFARFGFIGLFLAEVALLVERVYHGRTLRVATQRFFAITASISLALVGLAVVKLSVVLPHVRGSGLGMGFVLAGGELSYVLANVGVAALGAAVAVMLRKRTNPEAGATAPRVASNDS
jgi:hypothetical protein